MFQVHADTGEEKELALVEPAVPLVEQLLQLEKLVANLVALDGAGLERSVEANEGP